MNANFWKIIRENERSFADPILLSNSRYSAIFGLEKKKKFSQGKNFYRGRRSQKIKERVSLIRRIGRMSSLDWAFHRYVATAPKHTRET
jgi:hypothetical protein